MGEQGLSSGADNADNFSGDGVRHRGPMARALFGDIVQFVDFIVVILTAVLVAYVYHVFYLGSEFDIQYYAAAGIMGATGLTALMRRDGYYDFDQAAGAEHPARAIVSRWALVLLGLLAFGFALKISENFSRAWLGAWSVTAVSSVIAVRLSANAFVRKMSRDGGVFARRVAVVGATALGVKFTEHAKASPAGLIVDGIYAAGLADAGDGVGEGVAIKGDLNDLVHAARHGEIDDVVIATPRASTEEMQMLVRRLSILPVSIAICPNIHWLDHLGGAISRVGGVRVLSLYRRPLEGWGSVIKTLEDYLLGSLALIALSPVMLAIAVAIKLQGKGPILFAQKRHGFNNAVFKVYKFRTMTVAEDGDVITQAKAGDARITPLGGFLRRYSLDELPQLFNVIKGEMSLVGPRPHALAHNHQYARAIENYSGRHKVKPGITGWAQVNGYRGETSENEQMEDRVRYDLAYVDNWSPWFDIKILFLTVKAVVFPQNAV
ncbi:undecaprenyl-phosphate glucose phosphotransferase [Hyphococcus luteus]|uniref:Undecaprenyl-phosphate glucose phosphotransferase n=1 Tax=Hyphococcus luteus TaxID=2058213 RepID=A0A2S7K475_9PROT|nr:undecaprenyl-phosphate glucose phosphotransferase [Marinicaulis flavus]PQA87310.1 undecaprenyl-phosphate glucose phosphotransferase [Marinicaulis flavus]